MTLFQDVVAWATGRPWWQQQVIVCLADGETLDDDECRRIAQSLLGELLREPAGG